MVNHRSSLLLHSSSDLYGASKILLTTVKQLKEKGEQVQVVLSEEGPLVDAIQAEGIKVHIIRLGILRRKYFNPKGLVNRSKVLRQAYRQLIDLCKKERITHLYSNTSAVLVGAFVARKLRIFHTWHIHEIITQPAWFAKLIGKSVGKYGDKVIVVSEAVKKHWESHVPAEKLEVIHNGIDYQPYLSANGSLRKELGIDDGKVVVGMIGRINSWKGQSYFLDMARILLKQFGHVHLLMAGDVFPGDEHLEVQMHEKIRDMELEDQITVLGFRKDVPELLAAMDIFVLPSIMPDPLPTVVLEAMAAGKPVVATAHGGACEMVKDGETGILIPWNNPELGAKSVGTLIENQDLRSQFGQKGRERVLAHFSLDAFGDKMFSVFNDAG
jgi:glycosyltransferase involved in cell wall biosynthesis